MGGTVVIKWGGGLITHKDQLCTANTEVIESLAKACADSSKRLVIVHGAGSFGHLKAKKFRLAEGRIKGMNQDDAVESVRSDMKSLNKLVMEALQRAGVEAKSFPPHEWALGTGPNFEGELPIFDGVTVVFVTLTNTKIELISPLGESSPIMNFFNKNQNGGIHHICYEVKDLELAISNLIKNNYKLIGDKIPKIGAHGKPVIFLHPSNFDGTLIELQQE